MKTAAVVGVYCLAMILGVTGGPGRAAPKAERSKPAWTAADAVAAPAELEPERFADPPPQYSMVPFWSWNSTLREEELRRQVREMVAQHVWGAFMHTRVGLNSGQTPYFSDGFWKAVEVSVDEARKTGLRAWLYDEDRWPSGSAGGRTVAADPEHNRALRLYLAVRDVEGPAAVKLNGDPDVVSVMACRVVSEDGQTLGELKDLTAQAKSTKPRWAAPEGKWRLVIARERRAAGEKVIINYLRKATVATFLNITHEEYFRRFGADFGTTSPGLFFDEIHNSEGDVVWGDGFAAEFKKRKGYDLLPLLPALKYDIGPETEKIRCDYFEVYTAIYEDAWFRQTGEWCEKHGILWTGHTVEELRGVANQGDYWRTMRHLQIPLADNEDFRYTWPRVIGSWKPRQIASLASLYGRQRAGSEALGGAGWAFTLEMGRYGTHMLGAYGINFFVPHLFHYAIDSPETDGDWPNSWFIQNPYWKYFKIFADDTARMCYALSCGAPVRDVAIVLPTANLWAGRGAGLTEELVDAFVKRQVECDVIDPESILAGKLARYKAAVLPGADVMETGVLEKLEGFVKDGGKLVVLAPVPAISREKGREDREFAERFRKLAGEGMEAGDPEAAVAAVRACVPQPLVILEGDELALRHEHRRSKNKEIFWIASESTQTLQCKLRIAAQGRAEQWDTETGAVRPLPAQVEHGGLMTEIAVGPKQGVLLVIDRTASGTVHALRLGQSPKPRTLRLDGNWSFLPVGGALDHEWRCDLWKAEVSIPVAHFQPLRECPLFGVRASARESERAEARTTNPVGLAAAIPIGNVSRYFYPPADAAMCSSPTLDDSRWRMVQLKDDQQTTMGAALYLSSWDAAWITTCDPLPFRPVLGGRTVTLSSSLAIQGKGAQARLRLATTAAPATVKINGRRVGAAEKTLEEVSFDVPAEAFVDGVNTITIEVARSLNPVRKTGEGVPNAAMLEGWIRTDNGNLYRIVTDKTWHAATENWQGEAWEYLRPPQAPAGEPPGGRGAEAVRLAWYRVTLPPGTVEVQLPALEGKLAAFADGKKVDVREGRIDLRAGVAAGAGRVLALRLAPLGQGQRGLMGEIVARCEPVNLPLQDWADYGMPWYSGRALYGKVVEVDEAFLKDRSKVMLDLGTVGRCAEVWVNGKLAGVRVWPPYKVEITGMLKPGLNKIAVVVANLLANQMLYRQFDSVRGHMNNRKWHDSNIRRDGWALASGLLAVPVIRAE